MSRLDYFPTNDLIKNYRNVFGSHDGSTVLYHMLYELGLFSEVPLMPEDTALKNYASRLLLILGGGEVSAGAVTVFLKHLMAQPLPKEENKKD